MGPVGGGSGVGGGRAERWWKEGMEDRKRAAWTGRSHRSRATSCVGCTGQEKRWCTVCGIGRVRGEAYRSSVIVQSDTVP